MTQSKGESFFEAVLNTAIGFVLSYIAGLLIYPLYGFHPTTGQNLQIIGVFTVLSVARGYAVRRWFNARLHRLASSLAKMTHLE